MCVAGCRMLSATCFAALIAGGVISATGWMQADPILSAGVALLTVRSGWWIARESAHILLEGAPTNLHSARVERELLATAATVQIELVECAEEDFAAGEAVARAGVHSS
jgi:Co/Zn/Cd efflux system component